MFKRVFSIALVLALGGCATGHGHHFAGKASPADKGARAAAAGQPTASAVRPDDAQQVAALARSARQH